jgi:acetate kinase
MNVLVFSPSLRRIACSCFVGDSSQPVFSWVKRGLFSEAAALDELLEETKADVLAMATGIDAVCIRLPYGGTRFGEPVLADADALKQLEAMFAYAPLHLPAGQMLARRLAAHLPCTPVYLCFETAFFTRLPAREYLYGLDAATTERLELRRFGYHGLYHAAAARLANGSIPREDSTRPLRVLSICLDSQPEISAVVGAHPVTTTSGATPLEGLPGYTSCGELDPSIVLMLCGQLGLGPEQINDVLTRRSGLAALAGKPTPMEAILTPHTKHRLARSVLRYRILLACGAGVAAMGGLDAVVFSGKHAACGQDLLRWLRPRLQAYGDARLAWLTLNTDVHRLAANEAYAIGAQAGTEAA